MPPITQAMLEKENADLHDRIAGLEEQLAASQRAQTDQDYFHLLFENSMDAILLTAPDGNIYAANPAACQMFGRTEQEIIQAGRSGVVDVSDPRLRSALEERARTGKFLGELTFLRKDGSKFPGEISTNVFEMDTGTQRTSMIIRDVSERKRAEARIDALTRLYITSSQINQAIAHFRERETLIKEICRVAVEYGNYRLAWVGLARESDQTVTLVHFAGEELGYLDGLRITYRDEEAGRGPTGTAIRENRCVICQDIATDPLMRPWRERAIERGYFSSAAVPIRMNGKAIGAFMVYAGNPHAFTPEDEKLLTEIGDDISFAFETIEGEAQARRAEKKFEDAFRSSPAAMTITRIADGKLLDVNETFLRLFEFDRAETVGHTSTELNMLDPEARRELIRRQLEAGGLQNAELQTQSKSGKPLHLLFSSKPMEVAGEACHLTTMIDITERKRAELEKQKFFAIAESSSEFIGMCDLEMQPIYVNPAGIRMVGLPDLEAACRVKVQDYFYPEDQEFIAEEFFPRVLREGQGDVEIRLRHFQTGEPLWMFYYLFNVRDAGGNIIGWATVSRDVTERKRAEDELRESQQHLSTIYKTVGDIIFHLAVEPGEKYRFISVNPAFVTVTGLPEDAILGRLAGEVIPEPSLTMVLGNYRRAIENREIVRWEETSNYPNGLLVGEVTIAPVFDVDGICTHLIGSVHDVTARKQAEDELRLSHRRLEELSRRLIEAQEAERRFIGRELHDQIGQILTAMKITLDIARQVPPEIAEKKLQQAQELTGDLLNRVSHMSLELRPPMLDDLGLVPALLWHINRYQEQTGIAVDFKHSGVEGVRFAAEVETTVYRAIQEALTNVARHAQAKTAQVEICAQANQLEIKLEDDGQGFDVAAALASNRGLSGMSERVNLLGGTFEIQSAPGAGTRELIRLPVRETQP